MKKSFLLRLLCSLTAIILCLASIPLCGTAEGEEQKESEFADYEITETDRTWYDAGASEYVISTMGELAFFCELAKTNSFAGKTVKLGADIIWNEGFADENGFVCNSGKPYKWTPIGPSTSVTFQGTFDGQGHKISGIYIHDCNQNRAVFGVVKNCTIKNVTFEDINITLYKAGAASPSWCGIVSSQSWGSNTYSNITLKNCYLIGDVENSEYLGGLCGSICSANANNLYENCSFTDGAVSGKDAIGSLLGLVRNKNTVTLKNCVSNAKVTAATESAGLIGRLCGNAVIEGGAYLGKVSVTDTANGANAVYLSKKDQGGAAQADDSTVDFRNFYPAVANPVTASSTDAAFTVTVSYADSEAKTAEARGGADASGKINALFVNAALPEQKTTATAQANTAQSYSEGGIKYARFVANLKNAATGKCAGFKVIIIDANGARSLGDIYVSEVYTTLNAKGDAKAVSAGSNKVYALSLKGIPEGKPVSFVVIPFSADSVSSAKEYGTAAVYTYVNGAYIAPAAN